MGVKSFLLFKVCELSHCCVIYSVLWWHALNAILSAHSGPRLAYIQVFYKFKFLNWKEIACDWLFFCFVQTMVYQRAMRAFHQNLHIAPPFSPPFPSILFKSHSHSLHWKGHSICSTALCFSSSWSCETHLVYCFSASLRPTSTLHDPIRTWYLEQQLPSLLLEVSAKRIPECQLMLRCWPNSGISFLQTYMRYLYDFIASI